jgi:hypothetical protein
MFAAMINSLLEEEVNYELQMLVEMPPVEGGVLAETLSYLKVGAMLTREHTISHTHFIELLSRALSGSIRNQSYRIFVFTILFWMPRPRVDIDRFRDEIERRVLVEKQRHKDIVIWLAEQGCKTTQQTLLRRCRDWGASRRRTVSSDDPALIAAIQEQFSSTFANDTKISNTLNARGIHTSPNQVNEIRHKHGLHRRTRDEADRAEARQETFNRVKQAIDDGIVRPHNREAIRKALLEHYRYHAREGDVREALKMLNPEGLTTRRPEFQSSPTNDRIVDFAFNKINEILLSPFGAIGAIGSTPEAKEEVQTILHNLIQFGQAQK